MATQSATDPVKAAIRQLWAAGDYHRFAKSTVWEIGEILVDACGVAPGQRVLDVAAGTGNVALRAAQRGADVVASDLTPENFAAGRREAEALGVELEWVEADAEALPFGDGEFDVVTSAFGAIFAPHHRAVADELVRVCKPGGTIGMANFAPRGMAGDFFALFGRHAPPLPDGALPPVLWGDEEHVRDLFEGRLEALELTRRSYVERADSPSDYVTLFREAFGPIVGLRALLGDEAAAFDRELEELAERSNTGAPGGPAEYEYEYLLVVARPRSE